MILRIIFVLCCLGGLASGQGGPERVRLYKKTDPSNPGGLKGRIGSPSVAIEEILAVSADDVEQVYQGEIRGSQRTEFQFTGLPVGKYDLVVIYPSEFHEGLHLNRESSSLVAEDLKKISESIQRSEPFFTKKIIHRVEGETGRGQGARAICTYVRDKGPEIAAGQTGPNPSEPKGRRTFKLVLLKDVGPGWQIVRARDLYPVWINPGTPLPAQKFNPALKQIRVADQMKDIGVLELSE
jgi:hypothetical protein